MFKLKNNPLKNYLFLNIYEFIFRELSPARHVMEWLIDFFQNVDFSSIFLAQWDLGEGHSQWDLGKGHFSTACGFDSLE